MSIRKRLPTALILLSLLFLLIQFGPPLLFFLLGQIVITAAVIEFFHLAKKKDLRPQRIPGLVAVYLLSASFYFRSIPLDAVLFLLLLLFAFYFVISFNSQEKLPYFPASFGITFLGALYISFPLNFLYWIRLDHGTLPLYFLFSVIFLGDSGAYFVGGPFGKKKMTPVASPNKTWEGSAGGILFAALGALAARQLFLTTIPIWKAIVCGIGVHIVAQVSDPLESLFKRAVGVKDSSNVLPGHGGVLDRIDSLILAAPLFYYIVKYFWN